jgi:hypothetical protein
MNFAVDLIMMKSMNKNGGKEVSTIYNTDGENLFCLNGEDAIKYYETINFLRENNKDTTLENVRRVVDIFLKEYDPFFRLLSPKKYIQSYREHIEKIKKKRLMQVGMESVGFLYMGYQIFNSIKKFNSTSKLKYIPLVVIVLYVVFNLFNTYNANYTEKEYNILKTLKSKIVDISGNVYVQIPEIEKINSKTSSLFYEMLKNKSEIILKYVDNPDKTKSHKNNIENNKSNITSDETEIGIELSKLEELEKKLVPSAFMNKPDLFIENVTKVPELFSQESILIEIEEDNTVDNSLDNSVDNSLDNSLDNNKFNQEYIQNVQVEDDKLSITEEILEEIKNEIEQEQQQEQIQEPKQIKLVNDKEIQEEQKEQPAEIIKEKPKRKGRQSNTIPTKKTKAVKTKAVKSKQQNKTK